MNDDWQEFDERIARMMLWTCIAGFIGLIVTLVWL